jgi:thiol-disulfide isomerase/thioredoxin
MSAFAAGIGDGLKAAKAQLAAGDLDAAAPALQQVLAQTMEQGWDKLTAAEVLQVAEAHRLLMGIAAQKALDRDGLTQEQAEMAASWAQALPGPSIKVVSFGEQVNVEEHLMPGKTTIVDFFSKYCPPCVRLSQVLEPVVLDSDELFLLKVDINRPGVQGIDWGSPVAEQYGLKGIPHLRIYGPDGELIAEGKAAMEKVGQLLSRGEQ